MAELDNTRRGLLFLKPWKALSEAGAKVYEDELARELAVHRPLYGHQFYAVAITVESDDVLYRLDDGTFAQVHLTFMKESPERPGWPGHDVFETLADWMIERMLPSHIERFDLWPEGS